MSDQILRGEGFSRRSFLNLSAAATAAMAFQIVTEPMLAAQIPDPPYSKTGVMINANENPLGPCTAAREAMTAIIPDGGRYQFPLANELVDTFAKIEGLKPEYVSAFAGSSEPLHYSVLAFTGPKASFVNADPTYEAGFHAAHITGARDVRVPLNKTYAHDVKAMIAAAPDAGLFYICTPNNPTGSLTPHDDIEYLLDHKPKGSVVLVDEAYLHFTNAPSTLDLVKAHKDIIVLRTFSKIYGMAGIRCGFAIGKPDLLKKVENCGGGNPMPVTASAAAIASLKSPHVVEDRKRITTATRQSVFHWLDKNGYKYLPSESNCFMLDVKRPGREMMDAMAKQDVYVGRVWPIYPTMVRITVGTDAEMDKFQEVFARTMKGAKSVGWLSPEREMQLRNHDGIDGLRRG